MRSQADNGFKKWPCVYCSSGASECRAVVLYKRCNQALQVCCYMSSLEAGVLLVGRTCICK